MAVEYDAFGDESGLDTIKKLEGVEAIREVPGMYVGDPHDGTGLHHLLVEMVTLSVDAQVERLGARRTRVGVTLRSDGSVEVRSDAPEIIERDESAAACPGLKRFTEFSEVRRDGRDARFRYGFHGRCDLSMSALAERLTVDFPHRGRRWTLIFAQGRLLSSHSGDSVDGCGDTVLSFKPDPTIFSGPTLSFAIVESFLEELSFLVRGMTFDLRDETSGRACSFGPSEGAADYVRRLDRDRGTIHATPIALRAERSGDAGPPMRLDLALRWNASRRTQVMGYVNGVYSRDDGTHVDGLRRSLPGCLAAYAIEAGLAGSRVARDLCAFEARRGLTAIVSTWHPQPTMWPATRNRLVSPEVTPFVAETVNRQLFAWLKAHPSEARAIVGHVLRR